MQFFTDFGHAYMPSLDIVYQAVLREFDVKHRLQTDDRNICLGCPVQRQVANELCQPSALLSVSHKLDMNFISIRKGQYQSLRVMISVLSKSLRISYTCCSSYIANFQYVIIIMTVELTLSSQSWFSTIPNNTSNYIPVTIPNKPLCNGNWYKAVHPSVV